MECNGTAREAFLLSGDSAISLPYKRIKASSEHHYYIDDITKLHSKRSGFFSSKKRSTDSELICREQFVTPSQPKFVTLVNAPIVPTYLLRFSVEDSVVAHDFCSKAIESKVAEKAYCFLHVSLFGVNPNGQAPEIFVEAETKTSNYTALLELVQSSFKPEPRVTAYRTI